MYAPERQMAILEHARRDGRVEVSELAEVLCVTPETIRRDLTTLERRGSLRRVHGGAIPVERLPVELGVQDRLGRNAAEKDRIAHAAVGLVGDAHTLLIDAGTTCLRFAQALPIGRELTVVTHSVTIAQTFSDRQDIDLLLVGGRVRGRTLAAVGAITIAQLRNLTVDCAVLGINGVTPEFGFSTPDPEEAAVKAQIVRCGRTVIVLADHSKFGVDDFVHVADLDAADTVVTDAKADAEMVSRVRDGGVEVLVS